MQPLHSPYSSFRLSSRRQPSEEGKADSSYQRRPVGVALPPPPTPPPPDCYEKYTPTYLPNAPHKLLVNKHSFSSPSPNVWRSFFEPQDISTSPPLHATRIMILSLTFILLQALWVVAGPPSTSVAIEGPVNTAANGDVQIALPPEPDLPKREGILKMSSK